MLSDRQLDWIRKLVESNPENDRLFRAIVEKDEVQWKKLSPEKILKWLNNFSNETEVHCALVLADNILYYNLDDIRSLYKYILNNKVKVLVINQKFTRLGPISVDEWFSDYLRNRCLFVSFGRSGKSATSMIYTFKQSHGIDGLMYADLSDFLHKPGDLKDIEKVFLIDDFLGSGQQAKSEWFRHVDEQDENSNSLAMFKEKYPNIQFIYLALVGCTIGREELEKTTGIQIILGEELDERFKCFSENSVIFKDPAVRAVARKVMEEKGKILFAFPLGFDDMELAVAFNHNTPDNSLPVIWKKQNGTWFPLFERFE